MIQRAAPGALLAIDDDLADQHKTDGLPGKESAVELDAAVLHTPVVETHLVVETRLAAAPVVVQSSPELVELVAGSSSYPHFLSVEPVTTGGERSSELKHRASWWIICRQERGGEMKRRIKWRLYLISTTLIVVIVRLATQCTVR
jgi:hypothetical protein